MFSVEESLYCRQHLLAPHEQPHEQQLASLFGIYCFFPKFNCRLAEKLFTILQPFYTKKLFLSQHAKQKPFSPCKHFFALDSDAGSMVLTMLTAFPRDIQVTDTSAKELRRLSAADSGDEIGKGRNRYV